MKIINDAWPILKEVMHKKLSEKEFNTRYELYWAFTKFCEKDCKPEHRATLNWVIQRDYNKDGKVGIPDVQVCFNTNIYADNPWHRNIPWFIWENEPYRTVLYLVEKL